MSGIGTKLSRHVLGMKFMRKTKDQIDRSGKVSSTTSTPASAVKEETSISLKNEPNATSTTSSPIVEEVWSYNHCERYIFGRQSYGGFNPAVEKNVKKGIWRPFYLDECDNPYESSDEDDKFKKQSDVDVSDEEMAKTYGSLIGTMAKKFGKGKGKGKKDKKFQGKDKGIMKKSKFSQKQNYSQNSDEEMESRRAIQKRQRESTGSVNFKEERDQRSHKSSPSKRSYDRTDGNAPPQKRRKFWKPSD